MPSKKFYQSTSSTKLLQPGREPENEDYGRNHKGAEECPQCHSVHFKKKWYRSYSDIKKENDFKSVRQQLCPACTMIKEKEFEGELFIENFPKKYDAQILHLIENFTKVIKKKEPQHRIIEVATIQNGYRITTTENQLVNLLAKKVKSAFHNVDVHSSYLPEPNKVNRIHVVYHSTL